MKLDRKTTRVYYEDRYLREVTARVVKAGPDYVELDRTVAYPEGGGQEPDMGRIECQDGSAIRFIAAKKMYGSLSGLAEFPDVQVDGVIWHIVDPQDQALLSAMTPGRPVTVSIDVERRSRLSLSHTASHFLYLGVALHRPDAIEHTLGCHIRTDGARFDFAVQERFTQEDLRLIEETANGFIERDAQVTTSSHPDAPDARRWHCEGHVIACGGTHLERAGPIGPLQVRRKRLGAGKERLMCAFPLALPEVDRYHGVHA